MANIEVRKDGQVLRFVGQHRPLGEGETAQCGQLLNVVDDKGILHEAVYPGFGTSNCWYCNKIEEVDGLY